jgi:hypothetical protein
MLGRAEYTVVGESEHAAGHGGSLISIFVGMQMREDFGVFVEHCTPVFCKCSASAS